MANQSSLVSGPCSGVLPEYKKLSTPTYCSHFRKLRTSSRLHEHTIREHAQHMVLNYYPPCPQPDLTYGLPEHTDPNFITILLQDEVPGLQVLKDGKWVAVDPVPNTFIISIGDQVQVMSNDKFKSILHQAVVNCDKEQISIPTFYCPSPEVVIGPASEFVSDDESAVYRQFTYGEYYEKFNGLEKCLDMFKTS